VKMILCVLMILMVEINDVKLVIKSKYIGLIIQFIGCDYTQAFFSKESKEVGFDEYYK